MNKGLKENEMEWKGKTRRERECRFTLLQRIQHTILFSSVFVLAITGLPRRYYDTWWADSLVAFFGGLGTMGVIHRIGAVVLAGVGIFHLLYYILGERDIPFWKRDVIPQKKDFTDFYKHLKYILRLSDEMPSMGRFTWYHKFDYLGAFWGLVIMGASGIIMWNFEIFLQYIPLAAIETIWVVHGEEGTLAILFLVLIHFYWRHTSPEVFPMNTCWLHGEISKEIMEKYHPEELKSIEKGEKKRIEKKELGVRFRNLDRLIEQINNKLGEVIPVILAFVTAGIYILILLYILGETLGVI